MFRLLQKESSSISFTASEFRVDQQNPTPLPSVMQGESLAKDETSACPPASVYSQAVPAHDLATLSRKKDKKAFIRMHLRHAPSWLYNALFFALACYFVLSTYCSVRPQLGCILPTVITGVIIQSDVWCNQFLSWLIPFPFQHDFASTQTGAVVAPQLTTPGIKSNPLSDISRNPAGACWSFRGNSGTFGIVLSSLNVIPSDVVIQRQLFNSTAFSSRAPHQVIVWGLVDGVKNMEAYEWLHDVFGSFARRPPLPMS
ncbi:hypothetical protein EI94DRAFT_1699675 [Lactarius quietus]|nr:hypothetical protein EI94DRAFT_1699675 [Lactarius quietus]